MSSKPSPTATAVLPSSAQALIDQAQALQDYRSAQRHVDSLDTFIQQEKQRRDARLLDARQRLTQAGGGAILAELDAARKRCSHE